MHTNKLVVLATAAAVAAGAGTAVTAGAQTTTTPADATTVSVSRAPALAPGTTSPFDVAGVKAIRRGKPIPAGYRLQGVRLDIQGTGPAAGAYLRFSCPAGTTLRSFGTSGSAGFRAEDPNYPGHRTTFVSSGLRRGTTGTIYAVCHR